MASTPSVATDLVRLLRRLNRATRLPAGVPTRASSIAAMPRCSCEGLASPFTPPVPPSSITSPSLLIRSHRSPEYKRRQARELAARTRTVLRKVRTRTLHAVRRALGGHLQGEPLTCL